MSNAGQSTGVYGGRRAASSSSRTGLRVLLTRSTFTGSVSGSNEALVRYALHLQRSGHLCSVTLLHEPEADNPFLARLQFAGVAVHCIAPRSSLAAGLLLVIWGLAIGLRLIPDPALASSCQGGMATKSLPRRAWHQLWLLLEQPKAARAAEHFAASGADLVHVVGSDLGSLVLIPAAGRTGLPVLFHELGGPDHPPHLRRHYTKLGKVLKECTEVAALANGWRGYHALARPIRMIPLLQDDSPLRGRAPSLDGSVRIGYAARLEHGKGVMVLLEAFARVRAKRSQAQLVIAGTGPLEAVARSRAAAPDLLGSCELIGYVSEAEKPRLLSSLDVFVLPSLSEGTPYCIVEAMVFGLAVVASDVGGMSDMLAEGAGLLLPPADVEALARALLRLVDDAALRAGLGRAARRQYEGLFRPDVVVEALLHEYRRIARRRDATDLAVRTHPWLQDEGPPPAQRAQTSSIATTGEI